MDNPPEQPPHIHLHLSRPDGTGHFNIGHFDEETLQSLQQTYCNKTKLDYDHIEILSVDKPVQLSLF